MALNFEDLQNEARLSYSNSGKSTFLKLTL